MIAWSDLRREPFRLFFPLGAAFGMVGVGHWLLYAAHLSTASSAFFHASMQVGAFMFCFIAGFLMTALPRFASAGAASSGELVAVLLLLGGYVLSASLGMWPAAQLCFIGLLVSLVSFAGRRFAQKRSETGPPPEFVWIAVALLHGIAGSVLLMGNQLGWLPAWAPAAGRPMMQQGFLFGIVLGVGGFMAPRLLGQVGQRIAASQIRLDAVLRAKKRRVRIHLAAGAAFFLTFVLEAAAETASAYLLRAAIVTIELAWTVRFWRLPRQRQMFAWLVWASVWFVCAGLWGVVFWPRLRVAMLHLSFIGGFSLMVFAVATMVSLSHSGEAAKLEKPSAVLWVVAIGVALAVVLRVAADASAASYYPLLGAASLLWVGVCFAWLLFMLPKTLKAASADEFERLHEAAKQRVRASV